MKTIPGNVMNDLAFLNWAARLKLSDPAIAIIKTIRRSNPVRRTEGRKNVHGRWASAKMGFTIQFESLVELARHIELENDPSVREYWEQPLRLPLKYRALSGKNTSANHTPDTMVLGEDEAWFEECKPEEELRKLSLEMPNRYVQRDDGSWRCPPGEVAAEKFGMGYKVYSSAKTCHVLTRNLVFLDDYRKAKCPAPDKETVESIKEAVCANQGINIPELLRAVPKLKVDDVHCLISAGTIFADIRRVLLIEPHGVRLFSDANTAQAMDATERAKGGCVAPDAGPVELAPTAKLIIDGKVYMVGEVSDQMVQLFDSDGQSRHRKRSDIEGKITNGEIKSAATADARLRKAYAQIVAASPEAKRVALARWHLVQPHFSAEPPPKPKCPALLRQLNRLIASYRQAQRDYDNGFLGLLPKERQGNQSVRFDDGVRALMEEFAKKFEDVRGRSASSVHNDLKVACEAKLLSPPSRASWGRFLRGRPRVQQILKRRGRRAAYQKKQGVWILDRDTPVHGDRWLEIAHIDHT